MTPPPPLAPPNYDEEIDFQSLALTDPDFAKIYDAAGGEIDFQDPKALQQLTKSLLKRDFGLLVELRDDRLCPPVPVRYNYVRWIQDLLDSTSDPTISSTDLVKQEIRGLDIGIGASCIYSLLACTLRPSWRTHGTEIDASNFSSATKNITLNKLTSHITLRLNESSDPLINLESFGLETLDFTMCNPPFYTSTEDMHSSYASKSAPPHATCTGAEIEMICEGGDAGFVLRMIEESLVLKTKVRWYTSMLGKLSSVHVVVDRLKELGVGNWAVTLLRAGNKTRRWAVGWSFGDLRPSNDVARGSEVGQHILPLPTAQTVRFFMTRGEAVGLLNETLGSLDLSWEWNEDTWMGSGTAKANVWSRSARRKRKRQEVEDDTGATQSERKETNKEETEVALGFRITVEEDGMEVRWLRGKDGVLFESFCGMLKRAMTTKSKN